MPPRYSSVQRVADHLGLEFSGLQAAEAERALLAAEAWLDARTGRTWTPPAAPVAELRLLGGGALYLEQTPVASVSLVEARSPFYAAVFEPLAAGSYALLDPDAGLLGVPPGYSGWWLRVTYTPAVTAVDPRVARIATLVAAAWLRPTLDATTGGGAGAGPLIARRLGDVEVRYAAPTAGTAAAATATPGGTVPDAVAELVWQLAGPVLA